MAVFGISNPWDVRLLDMIVTEGDFSPEGLVAYQHRGKPYLAIANEATAPGAAGTSTTVYELGWAFTR